VVGEQQGLRLRCYADGRSRWVEFEDGQPWREIALDADGLPVGAAPSTLNYGFWNDTNMTLDDFRNSDALLREITTSEFELTWAEYFAARGDKERPDQD